MWPLKDARNLTPAIVKYFERSMVYILMWAMACPLWLTSTPGAPAASSMQFMRCDNTALLLCIAVSWHLAMSYNVPSRPLLWIILAPPGCSVSTWCWLGASCPEMIKFVFLVIVTLSGYFLVMQSFCICWFGPYVLENVMECNEKI